MKECIMQLIVISVLILVLCPLTQMSFADEKSDCLTGCAIEKRAKDMYCPPAGGFSDDDNKQCMEKNTTSYTSCVKTCSPVTVAPPVVEQPPAIAETPPATNDEPAVAE
jgi:hypothetical protein